MNTYNICTTLYTSTHNECDIILRIGECPSNSPFLKNNGAEAHWF